MGEYPSSTFTRERKHRKINSPLSAISLASDSREVVAEWGAELGALARTGAVDWGTDWMETLGRQVAIPKAVPLRDKNAVLNW